MEIGFLYSRIRTDEKLLLTELRGRGHTVHKLDVRSMPFDIAVPPVDGLDLVLDRCIATSQSRYATALFEAYGVPVVNPPATIDVCADKVHTSIALAETGVPTPTTTVAFGEDAALEAVEDLGYPCVLKPVVGSWGRLVARLDSRSAAEAVLEHKATLGHYEHRVFYLQEYVEKPGRDIRVVAADGEVVAAMTRTADHWKTNAAAGAEVEAYEPPATVRDLVAAASAAVGGGLLGIDLMEAPSTDPGFVVHEVNAGVEFKALDGAVETDVPAAIVDWLETVVADAGPTGPEVSA
ncbi:MAG: RimK family alpha-L-glutamate ligase [Halobacteriota archaeon]